MYGQFTRLLLNIFLKFYIPLHHKFTNQFSHDPPRRLEPLTATLFLLHPTLRAEYGRLTDPKPGPSTYVGVCSLLSHRSGVSVFILQAPFIFLICGLLTHSCQLEFPWSTDCTVAVLCYGFTQLLVLLICVPIFRKASALCFWILTWL